MAKMRTDDGVELHYQVDDFRDPWITEPGDTVLLSHGFARSIKWWTQWVPKLSRKYRVLRFDVRGCGESSAPPKGVCWSLDRVAKDALDLIDHLEIEKVHWVGFESGGVWGILFAINYPDRLQSLTVLNTPSALPGHTSSDTWKRGLADASEIIQNAGLRQWLTDTYASRGDPAMQQPILKEWHIAEQSKTPDEVGAAITRIISTLDLSGQYSRIRQPMLIMAGDRVHNCQVEELGAVQRQASNARLLIFPNMGAGTQLLMPDRCVEELLRFLDEISVA